MRPALQRLLARSPSLLSLRRSIILNQSSSLPTACNQWQSLGWRCWCASVHTKTSNDELSSVTETETETSTFDLSNEVRSKSAGALFTAAPPRPGLDLSKPFRGLKDVDTSDYRAIIEWLDEAQQRNNAKRHIKIAGVDATDKRVVQEGWNALGNLLARDNIDVGAVWKALKDVKSHDRLVLMIEYFSRLERDGPNAALSARKARTGLVTSFVTGGAQLEAVRRASELTRGKTIKHEDMVAEQNWIAHLLATRWVSLDISISTLHALGVETLGPLSLQAIALREPNAADLAKRIDQLHKQGITLGNSTYSRAISSFAKRGQQELLQMLLESDQHPASFDDPVLQRQLLRKHQAEGNWQQEGLLRSVQSVQTIDPVAEQFNVQLQENAKAHDQAAMIKTLETMRMRRIPVESASIWRILKAVLRPRVKGHRPNVLNDAYDMKDTDLAISILKNIMVYGGYVPIKAWTEVTRRLGMAGRLDDLYSVSIGLANAYSPRKPDSVATGLSGTGQASGLHLLDPSHDFHPLRILFPDVRQRAIVEWSFIHGMESFSSSIRDNLEIAKMTPEHQLKRRAIKAMMSGVFFLKQLAQRGVYIKDSNVRRAVHERLVILYGPGISSKVYNRAARPYNPVTLPELVKAVEKAWDKQLWPDIEGLEHQIQNERDWNVMLPRSEGRRPQVKSNDAARRPRLDKPQDDM